MKLMIMLYMNFYRTIISIEYRIIRNIEPRNICAQNARFPEQEVSFSYPVFDEMEVWFGR